MSVYVLVLLIAGHWMTISDSQGNPKTFNTEIGCEVAFTAASLLDTDRSRVDDHQCVEKDM